MKRFFSTQMVVISALCTASMLALPSTGLAGQHDRASGGSAGGGGGAGGGATGGGTVSAGGSVDRGSGGGGGAVSGSGGADSGSNRGGATGSSGVAMPRGSSGDRSGGGTAPRYTDGGGRTGTRVATRAEGDPSERSGVPRHSRPRDPNEPTQGTAVPRPPDSKPGGRTGGPTYIVPGGYYGGLGFGYPYGGGYSGGYYDPWYDPWYGSYPGYGSYSQSSFSDEGALRLKIKPRDAEVYVDGFFVGLVDEFDGIFQRLHIEPGAHRIEVRAPGYETLIFEVRIVPDRKITYEGEMHRVP